MHFGKLKQTQTSLKVPKKIGNCVESNVII